jgi:hypothetical protein
VGIELVADGYSWPYRWSVVVATLLYGLAAMLLIYRLARGYSGAWTAGVATLVTWLASPVLFFMYVSPPWSHVPSLFVTTLFLVFWLHTLERRSVLQWAILGLLGGLMTLCREQLGLFMLLPALEGLETYGKLLRSHRWAACYRLAGQHLLFLLTVGCMLIPQFLVYRSLNGRWGPSRHVSGKLDWASPHFFDTLFDPAHGAFMWTPVWLLGILGLPLLWARDRRLVLYLGAVFLAQVYINGAFNPTWHLTGSFGFRRLIEATPIFVLGLALLLDRLRLPPWLTLVFCAALIVWNVGLIAQWALPPRPIREGLIWEGMLERQVGVIQSAVERLPTLLFERCKFVENGRC